MKPPIDISAAAARLGSGELVAFPTETVYGLGASIRSDAGLRKIFAVKERPFFDPLICHIHSLEQIPELADEWPEWAQALTAEFWPGPLTVVVKKNPELNSLISSGLDSVGIRMPQNAIALELLKTVDIPLAAPSANRFGRTSPTSAQHVRDEFPNADILILEGTSSDIGIESTVVTWDQKINALVILRPGFITATQLQAALVPADQKVISRQSELSPGHTEFHYQPERPLVVFQESLRELNDVDFAKIIRGLKIEGRKFKVLNLEEDPVVAARLLYDQMRTLSKSDIDFMVTFKQPEMCGELWEAIWNRLDKAASLKFAAN